MKKSEAEKIALLLNERNQLTVSYTAEKILSSKQNYKFITKGEDLIAVAEIKQVQWYQWEICHVSVGKNFEGKGYGDKIIEIAENYAIENNARIIQCTIRSNNWASIKLFERNSYNKTSVFYNKKSKNYVNVFQKIVSIKN